MRLSPRWAEAIPAALLAVVAGSQLVLARTANLTPWKGGGFGMFSTLDHAAFRRISIVIDAPDRSEALELPESLEEIAARAANCPADWLLRRFAIEIVARERRHDRAVSHVTIQVWRTEFDRVSLHPEEQPLRSVRFEARELVRNPPGEP